MSLKVSVKKESKMSRRKHEDRMKNQRNKQKSWPSGHLVLGGHGS